MEKIGKKKKRRKDYKSRKPQPIHTPADHSREKGTPSWMKAMIPIFFLVVIVAVTIWQFSPRGSPSEPPPPQPEYPRYATGVFYNDPTIGGNGTKAQVPYTLVEDKKIVFVDLAVSRSRYDLEYEGRTIPLNLYKGCDYLPLIALYTLSGNVKVGIRTCEPCGGFNMYIDEGKYLVCDVCNTLWDFETFEGVSGAVRNTLLRCFQ